MKVLHLSAAGENTGAGMATIITHNSLISLGVDSKVLLLKSNISDPSINSYDHLSIFHKILRLLVTRLEQLPLFFYLKKQNQIFSPGLTGLSIRNNYLFKWADIIHIHWANHGFIDIKEISKWNKPVVWTLRDMWAFTGGCHYSFSCERFRHTCGLCPVLKSNKINDLSFLGQKRKLEYLTNEKIEWVAISSWMQKAAQTSRILSGKEINVIHSGVDSDKFKILEKNELRKKYGFNLSDKIILIGAGNMRQTYKGFEYVVKVLNKADKDLIVITFGSASFLENEIPQKFIHYGVIDTQQLRKLYNLADLFFGPSIAEAMGKTFLEAQLCGLPVLCFSETGPEDIVIHKETGYLAEYKSIDDLKNGLKYCLGREWNQDMIRYIIKQNFDIKEVVKKYIDIYKSLEV